MLKPIERHVELKWKQKANWTSHESRAQLNLHSLISSSASTTWKIGKRSYASYTLYLTFFFRISTTRKADKPDVRWEIHRGSEGPIRWVRRGWPDVPKAVVQGRPARLRAARVPAADRVLEPRKAAVRASQECTFGHCLECIIRQGCT